MKEIQYKDFSLRTHKKNWRINRPNVCQFELTFRCGLHCKHCYSDCYNKKEYIEKELNIKHVKFILDKVYQTGVIWLCFTGGDPLTREDFLEVYSYAKDKGFIITIFTNGYSMTKEIADYLKERPPFVVEITLNAVTEKTYEEISQVKGSFEKVMDAIKMITQSKLPLEIKTQAMKDNLEELPKIREFIENLGIKFKPNPMLHARLNGDLTPCSLRITPRDVLNLDKRLNGNSLDERCLSVEPTSPLVCSSEHNRQNDNNELNEQNNYLFSCAIGGGDGVYIDPFGNLISCSCNREPKINLLEESIEKAQRIILGWVRSRTLTTNSECRNCPIREFCYNCPGKALLEKKSLEIPVEWFCELAHLTKRNFSASLTSSRLHDYF